MDEQEEFDGQTNIFEALEEMSDPKKDTIGALGKTATSRAAAIAVFPRTGTQRWKILTEVVRVHPTGRTDEQLQNFLGLRVQSETPRRGELVSGGWLEAGGTRLTSSGSSATVWVLTKRAREHFGLEGGGTQADSVAV